MIHPEVEPPVPSAAHAMQPDAFAQACVVTRLGPGQEHGDDESFDDLATVRLALLSAFLDSGCQRDVASAATNRFIATCMTKTFPGDLWLGELPNGRPILLVKPQAAATHSREQIVQQVHQGLIARALSRQEPVPKAILDFYGMTARQ